MKRFLIALTVTIVTISATFGADIEAVTYNNLVGSIFRAQAPVVTGHYVIFTASGKARHVAIAFEYENYTKTYSFKRLARKDENYELLKDSNGKLVDQPLFYIAEVPSGLRQLRYRMVIDGLWTVDPLNEQSAYDYKNGMMVSTVPVDYYEIFQTANVNQGQVRFTYEGTQGSSIRLAGTFNDWDPFMYEMTEISPGKYELVLPLPAGTWQYAYFEGTTQLPDTSNHKRVYTKDGRIASVVTVK